MSNTAIASSQPWYSVLNRAQWITVIASNLGWLFDGYETYAVILTVGFALRQLLDPAQFAQIPVYAGAVIALTLLGWGIGGIIGGILADYLGRKRTMMLAILAYSIVTGLSAFAWDWMSFAVLRFAVGVAIGSEWVTGAYRFGAVARPCAWSRGRPHAMRAGNWLLLGFPGLGVCRRNRSQRMALHVPARRCRRC
jgi:MFS family permease